MKALDISAHLFISWPGSPQDNICIPLGCASLPSRAGRSHWLPSLVACKSVLALSGVTGLARCHEKRCRANKKSLFCKVLERCL